jgi:hypothetical protein
MIYIRYTGRITVQYADGIHAEEFRASKIYLAQELSGAKQVELERLITWELVGQVRELGERLLGAKISLVTFNSSVFTID